MQQRAGFRYVWRRAARGVNVIWFAILGLLFIAAYAALYLTAGEWVFEGTGFTQAQSHAIAICIMYVFFLGLWLWLPVGINLGMGRTETYWVFSGPYTLRQILGHTFVAALKGATIAAVFVTPILSQFSGAMLATAVGFLLFAMFMWFSLCFLGLLDLSLQDKGNRMGAAVFALILLRVSKVLLPITTVAVMIYPILMGIWKAYTQKSLRALETTDFTMPFTQLMATPGLRHAALVFEPFFRIMTAEHLIAGAAGWVALAIAMNVIAAALILLLNADYREAAIEAGVQRQEALLQLTSGEVKALSPRRRRATRLFALPFGPMRGCFGAIVWQQLTVAARRAGKTILLLPVGFWIMFYALKLLGLIEKEDAAFFVAALSVWSSVEISAMIGNATGSIRAQFPLLKTLPSSPLAVLSANALAPTLVMLWVSAWVVVASAVVFGDAWLVPPALLVLPFAFFAENTRRLMVHLFAPALRSVSPTMDALDFTRRVISLFIHLFTLGWSVLLVASTAFYAWRASDHSINVTAATLATGFALLAIVFTILATQQFARLDPRAEISP
jgi:hypothetical protein